MTLRVKWPGRAMFAAMNAVPALRSLAFALFALGALPVAFAADPPSSPAAAAAPPAAPPPPALCAVGQRCGDACIAWTEVCAVGLAATVGLSPPVVGGVAAPGKAPAGSVLLGLPAMLPPRGPSFRPEAPAYCTTGNGRDEAPAECMAYYQLGAAAGVITSPTAFTEECLQHNRCAGVCLQAGEVCPAFEPVDTSRASGHDGEPPAEGFR